MGNARRAAVKQGLGQAASWPSNVEGVPGRIGIEMDLERETDEHKPCRLRLIYESNSDVSRAAGCDTRPIR
jgi:hypothetical protein